MSVPSDLEDVVHECFITLESEDGQYPRKTLIRVHRTIKFVKSYSQRSSNVCPLRQLWLAEGSKILKPYNFTIKKWIVYQSQIHLILT